MRLNREILLGSITVLVIIYSISRSAASFPLKDSLYGVAPEDESYYKGLLSAGSIKCKDGSRKFSKSQLNDDFCDCPDGSDEPGTSACPNGKFFCMNAGHAPLVIFSSRVNDGICDCCDGSDEYAGNSKCQNTCWEAGKVAREKLKKKIATYQEGVTLRKHEIEQAKLSIAKEEAELLKLKDEEKSLQGLVQQLKEHKEQIEKAEEKERLQKEEEEKRKKEAELPVEKEIGTDDKSGDIAAMHNDVYDKIGTVDQPLQDSTEGHDQSLSEAKLEDDPTVRGLPDDKVETPKDVSLQDIDEQVTDSAVDDKGDLETENQEENTAEDSGSLSREELGRRVASRWTGERTESQEDNTPLDKEHQNADEVSDETNDEEYNTYDSEDDEHRYSDDENEDHAEEFGGEDHYDSSSSHKPESDDEPDLTDITGTTSSSWLEKIQQTVKSILHAVNVFQTPVNISEAAHVRKNYEESSTKLTKIQSRISKLTQKLKQDFGPDREFYSFYGQCFEIKQNKYVYKVCPFKEATQVEGYSTTRLGSWDNFEDSYRIMKFSNGDKCWNGPDRSLTVRLRCGLKNEVTDLDEPSRCEYLALLSTPAMCVDTKLKELQEKLELLNKEQPQGHDEL